MIELVPLCTARLGVRDPLDAGAGPHGRGVIVEIDSAHFSGRLEGAIEGRSSADWLNVTPGGLTLPDIRLAIRTSDSALVLMRYAGQLHRSRGSVATAVVAASFQTGDARYRWLTELLAVGKGRVAADKRTIDYEFYELR